jgi:hypothetical protein
VLKKRSFHAHHPNKPKSLKSNEQWYAYKRQTLSLDSLCQIASYFRAVISWVTFLAVTIIRPLVMYFYYMVPAGIVLGVLAVPANTFFPKKWLMFIVGAIAGEAIGMLSFIMAPFFLPWLTETRLETLFNMGFSDVVIISAGWVFFSGVWFAGALGFFIVSCLNDKSHKRGGNA